MKLVKITLILLIIGIVAACGPAPANDFVSHHSEVGGASITLMHPSDWVVEADADSLLIASDASLFDNADVSEGSSLFISTIPSSALITDDLSLLMRSELNGLWEQEGARVRNEAEIISINGHEAVTAVLDSSDGNTVLRFTMINTETAVVFVMVQTAVTSEDQHQPMIETIMNSIEISPILQ
ncbi:MAG: hypothetical protein GY943_33705 [Chloroflexi bacterium]|nr:hypothetical protein [Chloroflexota bacterium]